MKPTVHDIAAKAGVSLATVDRVVNLRSGVREVTKARVEAAIAELGYVRDVAAANLARGRIYPLIFILPNNDNSFMQALRDEVRAAIARGPSERVDITLIEIPPFDAGALVAALEKAKTEMPAGVAFVAVEGDAVRQAVGALAGEGVATVTLVSDLSGSRRDHYAGVDNIAAGKTAASLLGRFVKNSASKVAVLAGSLTVRDHHERVDGFRSVMASEFPQLEILPVLEGRDDAATVEELVRDTFARHPDIGGIYSLGAGNRGLIRALESISKSGGRPSVIAHELSAHTTTALKAGLIDAVLNQDAGHEVRSSIRVLKARADKVGVIAAQERIRLDIFMRDNLP